MPPLRRFRDHKLNDQYRVPRPKQLREVPSYLKKVTVNFFTRLFYIYKIVWEARPAILFIMLFMALLNGVIPVIGALISKEILNTLAKAFVKEITEFSVILVLLIVQFSYMFFSSLTTRIYHMITRVSGEVVSNHIKMKIMDKAREIDLSCYDLPDFYEKMENANREAGSRPIEILNSSFSVMSTVISMISFIVLLSSVSPLAPLVIVLVSIPTTIINFVYRRKTVNYMYFRSKDRRQMQYYSEVIVNKDLVKEVRIFGLSDLFTERYKKVFKKYFGGIKKLVYEEGFLSIGATLITTVVNCALFLYIAKGVFSGIYEVGDYSLYTGALNSVSSCVAAIIATTASIYEGTLFINNMISFMDQKPKIVPLLAEPRTVRRHTGHTIVFENVSFRYPGSDKDVLKQINLTIESGDTVVIVGLNGAGKTTLIKLLTRLYDPTEGRITLDGHDLREYATEELYDMFGIIFQDFGKYAVTVAENIAFGQIKKELRYEDIENAAQQSNAASFIEKLPHGYDTPLMRYFEEDGIELSIGQWQKLAIARAFYSDSDVLILDEPTASLDPMAEQEIFNQFDCLRENKTTIFVSHRLSSATTADKIVVLEYGHILEVGNHSQLMNNHGRYYELFSTQARRYVTPVDESDVLPQENGAAPPDRTVPCEEAAVL